MEESAILSSMAASNPRWLAPEILSGRGYTFSSDVYSFGVIMWEFLTWQIPWHECGPWQVCTHTTLSCHHCFTAESAIVASGGCVSGQQVCCFVRVDSTGHCVKNCILRRRGFKMGPILNPCRRKDSAPVCHAVCILHVACLIHDTCQIEYTDCTTSRCAILKVQSDTRHCMHKTCHITDQSVTSLTHTLLTSCQKGVSYCLLCQCTEGRYMQSVLSLSSCCLGCGRLWRW